jgi:Gp5 C-terminal repeat (3 copies)
MSNDKAPAQYDEGIVYGRVLDPAKFPDPKKLGRVKVRIPELHGTDSATGIPDEDIPWSQIERGFDHGTQQEMSSFGMPQNDAIVKCRINGNDVYSPLVSGAPYSKDGPITEFEANDPQHKQYGYKDPLGGLIWFNMETKQILIDWTKYKGIHVKWPKAIFEILNTYNDDSYPPDAYGDSGWTSEIDFPFDAPRKKETGRMKKYGNMNRGGHTESRFNREAVKNPNKVREMVVGENAPSGGGGGLVPGDCPQTAMDPESVSGPGDMIPGDINWIIEGYYDKQIHKTYNKHVFEDACDTFDMNYHLTVGYDFILTVGGNATVTIGGSYTESSGYRNTTVGGVWDAVAEPSYWPWLSVGYADVAGFAETAGTAGYADVAGALA